MDPKEILEIATTLADATIAAEDSKYIQSKVDNISEDEEEDPKEI